MDGALAAVGRQKITRSSTEACDGSLALVIALGKRAEVT